MVDFLADRLAFGPPLTAAIKSFGILYDLQGRRRKQ